MEPDDGQCNNTEEWFSPFLNATPKNPPLQSSIARFSLDYELSRPILDPSNILQQSKSRMDLIGPEYQGMTPSELFTTAPSFIPHSVGERVSRGSSSNYDRDDSTSTSATRASQKEAEQRRRDDLKIQFEQLRGVLPKKYRGSRLLLLKGALEYIKLLESQVEERDEYIEQMELNNASNKID